MEMLYGLFLLAILLISSNGQKVYHQAIDLYETSVMKGNILTMTLTDFRAAFQLGYVSYDKLSICNFSMGYTGLSAFAEQNFLVKMNFSDFVPVGNDLYVISKDLTILRYRVDPDVTKLIYVNSFQINASLTETPYPKGYFSSTTSNNLNLLYLIDGNIAYALDLDSGQYKPLLGYSAIGNNNFRDFDVISFDSKDKHYLFIAAGSLGLYAYEIVGMNLTNKKVLKEDIFNVATLSCMDVVIDGDFLYVLNEVDGLHKFKVNADFTITKVSNFFIPIVGGQRFVKQAGIFLVSKKILEKNYVVQEIFWDDSNNNIFINREFSISEVVNHLAITPTVSFIIGEINNIQFLTGINKNIITENSRVVTNFVRRDIQEINVLNYFNKNEDYLVAVSSNSIFLYKLTYPNPTIKCNTNQSTPSITYPFVLYFVTRDCKNKTYISNDNSPLNMCNNSMPMMVKVYDTPQQVEDNSLQIGLGVGLSFGLLFLIIFVVIMYYFWRKHQNKFKRLEEDGEKRGRYQGNIPNQE